MNLVGIILIACVIFLVSVVMVTYTLAVTAGHVDAIWPYISSTGNYPIESCIFSVGVNLSAAVLMFLVIVRYWQILAVIENDSDGITEKEKKKRDILNKVSLAFGLMASVGLSMVGSFQQRLEEDTHATGACICSWGILIYNIFQTIFSFTMMMRVTSVYNRRLRLALLILTCLSFITIIGFGCYISLISFIRRVPEYKTKVNRPYFQITTALEWVFAFFNLALICSYYPDFRKVSLKSNEILFLE